MPKPLGEWAQKDLEQKQEILRALYNNIDELKEDKVALVKFLAECLGKEPHEVNELFSRVSDKACSLKEFESFFELLKPLNAKQIPLNCDAVCSSFNPWPKPTATQYLPPNSQALLEEYMLDSGIPSALSVSDSQQTICIGSADVDGKPNVYPIHSVAKVLTGIMTLMMMKEKPDGENYILPQATLDKPIDELLDKDAWDLLPKKLQTHLQTKRITLKQLMTHDSGLGDYGYDRNTGTYRDKLEAGERLRLRISRIS